MSLILIALIVFLLLGGSYYGYRRQYYGIGGVSAISVLLVVLLALFLFGGQHMSFLR